jgi:enamine deaminase RidA (YjgF/YER057c/UK114 family)
MQHPVEISPVVLSGPRPTPSFRRQKRLNDGPFFVCQISTRQECLPQKAFLNQKMADLSSLNYNPPKNRVREQIMKFDRELISNGNPMEAVVGFSRAVRVGPFISIGGTAPVGPDGKTVGVGDVAAQTRQCIEIIKAALEQAGSGLHDVVRTRVILTDIDNWKAAIDVRKEYFKDVRPVDTIMAIDRFVNPEWLVEFEADAVISGWSDGP